MREAEEVTPVRVLSREVGEPVNSDPGAEGWRVLVPEPERPVSPSPAPPTFSVVVAAFQAEATLPAALDSVLGQTRPAAEIIVCDDGSTDGTARVLASYGDRVHVIRQPNGGEAAAKNAAAASATCDYVVVLDADDVFLPRRLEALAWLAMRRPDLDVLTTDAVVEAGGREIRRAYHAGWTFPVENQRASILSRNFVLGLAAVRRDRWIAVGGFDEQLSRATDWDFWLRLIMSGSRAGLVDHPLARYRLSRGTLSADRIRLVEGRIAVLSRALERTDLTPAERATATGALGRQRRELAARRAEATLADGGWAARVQHARLLTTRGVTLRRRLGAALAIASPGLAARRHRRRCGGTTEIGAGLRVPNEPQP